MEFQTRREQVSRTVVSYKTVRRKTVSCKSRGVRCRKGQRYKTVRIKPRRVAVKTLVTETVTRHYMYAGSSAGFSSGSPTGLRIVDITDPANAQVKSFYVCHTNQNDIQVLERGSRTYVLMGLDAPSNSQSVESKCFSDAGIDKSGTGLLVVDVTDVAAPRAVGFLPLLFGVHNSTIHPGGRYVYVSDSELLRNGFREPDKPYSPSKIQIVDVVDPNRPVFIRDVELPPGMSSHDITFNGDGTRAYAAALSQTVILDSSNPSTPRVLRVIEDPTINIHHQADPYQIDGKTYLVITDELAGAAGNGGCPGGGLHIYDITNEMLPIKIGVFVIPDVSMFVQDGRIRCTSHVLRIYPDQKILTIAWYAAGIWVIDISNPFEFKAVGMANPTNIDGRRTDAWSAKLYNGHLFTNDLGRGIDIFAYFGPASPIEVTRTIESMQLQAAEASTVSFAKTDPAGSLFCFELPGA